MSAVTRRTAVRLALLAVTAVGATGCATFTDNDVVARVGDDELRQSDLEAMLAADVAPGEELGDTAPASLVRSTASDWIRERLMFSTDIDERYTTRPADLGLFCLDIMPAVDELDARSLVQRIAGGESWDDVVAPIEAAQEGFDSHTQVGCLSIADLGAPPEFEAQLAALVPGGAPDVFDLGAGTFVVLRAQAIDQVDALALLTALQSADPESMVSLLDASATADVFVDPRIGAYDAGRLAIGPLG